MIRNVTQKHGEVEKGGSSKTRLDGEYLHIVSQPRRPQQPTFIEVETQSCDPSVTSLYRLGMLRTWPMSQSLLSLISGLTVSRSQAATRGTKRMPSCVVWSTYRRLVRFWGREMRNGAKMPLCEIVTRISLPGNKLLGDFDALCYLYLRALCHWRTRTWWWKSRWRHRLFSLP